MAKKKAPAGNVPRLLQFYRETIVPQLIKDLNYKNIMQVPKVEKIILSVGVAEAVVNKKILDVTTKELGLITGQRAIKTQARKSIANFKIRQGMDIGAKVTLRGTRMYEFLDRLVNIALPRVKDFRGLNPRGFDGRGNFSFGILEQIIFPEIDFDKIEKVAGMNIAFVTDAKTDDEARHLLKGFGMPFAK